MSTIRSIRERLGMSQAELADSIGMTQMTISNYETGRTFVSPFAARMVIDVAKSKGIKLSFNDIYADIAEKSVAA